MESTNRTIKTNPPLFSLFIHLFGWRVRVVYAPLLRLVGLVMAGSRRWSVESKDFELLVKGGAAGVRLFERSNGKQRSIFLKKDGVV
jgi:hypothetical protein